MTATARRHPEGSLVYVLDQTDLYLRVRDGVRQVQVNIDLNREHKSAGMAQKHFNNFGFSFIFQLGGYIPLPREDVSVIFPFFPSSRT